MIKAAGQTGLGVPIAFFGLSGENITRLVAGEPIRVSAADMQAHGIKLRFEPHPPPDHQCTLTAETHTDDDAMEQHETNLSGQGGMRRAPQAQP